MSYTASLKLKVVQYTEKHGKRPAGHKFYEKEQNVRECTEKQAGISQ